MTLRYDSFDESESDAWKQEHPPLVTARIWLGPNGMVMTQVTWHDSINAEDEAMLKPLEEMLTAATALHSTGYTLMMGLAVALEYRDAVVPAAEGN